MITFADAAKMLGNKPRKKIDHNTYLERLLNDDFGVRLYDTVIVEIKADGSYRLNTGRYKTETTRDRLNKFGPVRVDKKSAVWYVGDKEFYGFMVIKSGRGRWLTDTAASMCMAMLEANNFASLPILADALQEANCDDDEILSKCRAGNLNSYDARQLVNLIMV